MHLRASVLHPWHLNVVPNMFPNQLDQLHLYLLNQSSCLLQQLVTHGFRLIIGKSHVAFCWVKPPHTLPWV